VFDADPTFGCFQLDYQYSELACCISRSVIPSGGGGISDTQGCRALMHFSIYHQKILFAKCHQTLKEFIAVGSPLGAANYIFLL